MKPAWQEAFRLARTERELTDDLLTSICEHKVACPEEGYVDVRFVKDELRMVADGLALLLHYAEAREAKIFRKLGRGRG